MIFHEIIPVIRPAFHSDWTFWVLFTSFAILAWIQNYYHKVFILALGSVFTRRNMTQLIREANVFRLGMIPGLIIIYLCSISFLIFEIKVQFNIRLPFFISDFRLFLLIFTLITLFWAVKLFLMDFLAIIFKTDAVYYEYKLNLLVTTSMLGVVLLPLMTLLLYLKLSQFLWIGIFMAGILTVFRFIKGFLIGLSLTRFSYFFLFVYLCTLEILPLLVVLKLISIYL